MRRITADPRCEMSLVDDMRRPRGWSGYDPEADALPACRWSFSRCIIMALRPVVKEEHHAPLAHHSLCHSMSSRKNPVLSLAHGSSFHQNRSLKTSRHSTYSASNQKAT